MTETPVKVEVKLPESFAGNSIYLFQGKSIDQEAPETVVISGKITAPAAFWEAKKQNYDPLKCHVKRTNTTIELVCNEHDPYCIDVIKGSLNLDSETARWNINNIDKTYTNSELAKLVKANEYLFADKGVFRALYNSLIQFEANVTANIQDVQKTSGDRTKAVNLTVTKNIVTTFVLKTRIYEKKREEYVVEIGTVVTGHNVSFYLDSFQLSVRMSELQDELIEKHSNVFLGVMAVIDL